MTLEGRKYGSGHYQHENNRQTDCGDDTRLFHVECEVEVSGAKGSKEVPLDFVMAAIVKLHLCQVNPKGTGRRFLSGLTQNHSASRTRKPRRSAIDFGSRPTPPRFLNHLHRFSESNTTVLPPGIDKLKTQGQDGCLRTNTSPRAFSPLAWAGGPVSTTCQTWAACCVKTSASRDLMFDLFIQAFCCNAIGYVCYSRHGTTVAEQGLCCHRTSSRSR